LSNDIQSDPIAVDKESLHFEREIDQASDGFEVARLGDAH
jgi:hypothetical protein